MSALGRTGPHSRIMGCAGSYGWEHLYTDTLSNLLQMRFPSMRRVRLAIDAAAQG